MMRDMMSPDMMWGMGAFGLLGVIVLVFGNRGSHQISVLAVSPRDRCWRRRNLICADLRRSAPT